MKRTPLAKKKPKEIEKLPPAKEAEKKKEIPAPVSVKKMEAPAQPTPKPQKKSNFILKSSAFANKRKIPSKYSRRKGNVSPPLAWKNPPEGTKSYVLTFTEPEAPGGPFTHWVVYNISGDQAHLPEGLPPKVSVNGAQQTRNDFNGVGYGGPESTGEVRRYLFRLVALDVEKIEKPREETLQEHALGEATLIAFYP